MSKETGRVTVSTYVPEYEREKWKEHADRLDMSQSEFVRTMVQAGRRGFDLRDETESPERADVPDADPWGSDLRKEVLDSLEGDGPVDWNELVDELNGDFEDRLENVLDSLQDANRIRHRARQGGYFLLEDDDVE